ncbi:hypothetical protein Sxan_76560 [Streptomyces xanthophaeus]|uniref:Uncharacterized protein n=1 Tax=Streptomyces xanthophaeus TaxID=67385 RepID=A0A919H6Y1_9ACTN|nr:hypothetical protein Sxan_76560 [Streptomyces xanthophaeus]
MRAAARRTPSRVTHVTPGSLGVEVRPVSLFTHISPAQKQIRAWELSAATAGPRGCERVHDRVRHLRLRAAITFVR